jgi:ribosomal protein S18 acetylase RimI-like enzyme
LVLQAAEGHAKPKIKKIYLHVQVSNDSAKAFYERHGFTEVAIHEDYYRKIEPHDAWVLEKKF